MRIILKNIRGEKEVERCGSLLVVRLNIDQIQADYQ
jgi:hypothetical protein